MNEDSSVITYAAVVVLILGLMFMVAMVADCPVSP